MSESDHRDQVEADELDAQMRAGLDALAAEVGDPPPFRAQAPTVSPRRPHSRPYAIAAVIVIATLVGGGVAWMLRGDPPTQQVTVGRGQGKNGPDRTGPTTSDQPAQGAEGRSDVGNAAGEVVGSISNDEATAARDRIRDRLLELVGENRDLPQDQVNRLVDALEVLEPVAVTDAHGKLVGYLIHDFVPLDEYKPMRNNAQAVIDDFQN